MSKLSRFILCGRWFDLNKVIYAGANTKFFYISYPYTMKLTYAQPGFKEEVNYLPIIARHGGVAIDFRTIPVSAQEFRYKFQTRERVMELLTMFDEAKIDTNLPEFSKLSDPTMIPTVLLSILIGWIIIWFVRKVWGWRKCYRYR